MALKAKGLQLLREELRLRTDLVCEPRLPDYELTSLSIWGKRSRNSTLFRGFIEGLNRYRGETIQEKAEALFREAGMTDEQFEKLRQMLTE
ncbi:MAG: hypothetical protein K0Q59_4149 [Paenibacillus sp.]|jgi:hypothetical protein|nr:hypothetical protein [Paenibacillus sp.]